MGTVFLRRPSPAQVRNQAIAKTPALAGTLKALPDAAIARLSESAMAQMTQAAAPAAPVADGFGGQVATTASFAYDMGIAGMPGMPLDAGVTRGVNPIKLVPGTVATGGAATTGTISMTPTKRCRPFRLLIPSGQGSAVLVGVISAVAKIMGLDSSQSSAADVFSEKVRNGGRVAIPDLDANSPVNVNLTGLANSTSYYSVLFAWSLDEILGDPPFAGASYRGERFSYFGSTSISNSGNSTLKTTPVKYFQPKRLVFDETVSNFWSAAGVGLLVAAGYPTIADNIEELSSADMPLIAFSTVAEDVSIDFDVVPPNTAFNMNVKNTNTSQSVTAQGHAVGDMWE